MEEHYSVGLPLSLVISLALLSFFPLFINNFPSLVAHFSALAHLVLIFIQSHPSWFELSHCFFLQVNTHTHMHVQEMHSK